MQELAQSGVGNGDGEHQEKNPDTSLRLCQVQVGETRTAGGSEAYLPLSLFKEWGVCQTSILLYQTKNYLCALLSSSFLPFHFFSFSLIN